MNFRRNNGCINFIRIAVLILAIILLITSTVLFFNGNLFRELLPEDGVSFLFLSVGQANCALIQTPFGNAMIDTGSHESENTVLAALSYYGIEQIDLLILTHADEDHSGGLTLLLRKIPISKILMSIGTQKALGFSDQSILPSDCSLVTVAGGDGESLGEVRFEILSPSPNDEAIQDGGNESSLVIHVFYQKTNAIFPGDADIEGEKKALRVLKLRDPHFTCDLLLAAHHGSRTSSGEGFVRFLSPKYTVISCGLDNAYGHPSSEIVGRYENYGSTVLRTDLEGTLIFHSDGTKLERLR